MPVFLTLNGDNKGTIADTVVINNYPTHQSQSPITHSQKDIEDIAAVKEEPAAASDIDPSSLIFLPCEQNRQAVESLLKEALASSKKKSVVCRKLYQQRDLYNLHHQDDTTKAIIINEWVKRFGLERNFKALFNRKDFGNYYTSV